ncbi:MAG: triose-phosphate isomerase [Zoogloeaceae bacterium]|nr:triose-phosphate isomerase [Zoogloeaceae bacterium]
MRSPLVVGNWKMHGDLAGNLQLLQQVIAGVPAAGAVDMVVCAPFPYLEQVRNLLAATPVGWGAQTLSEHAQGAYTGEVSAGMLREFGCRYVIVGHSERRALFSESDEQVAAKFLAACNAGLVPILCVGETLAQRESGETVRVVEKQLQVVLDRAGVERFSSAVVAYEPVWAIGTGRTATPEQAQEVHVAIRSCLARLDQQVASGLQILYGGSVKAQNAGEIFAQADIDGGLIGGASLVADDFLAICQAANR